MYISLSSYTDHTIHYMLFLQHNPGDFQFTIFRVNDICLPATHLIPMTSTIHTYICVDLRWNFIHESFPWTRLLETLHWNKLSWTIMHISGLYIYVLIQLVYFVTFINPHLLLHICISISHDLSTNSKVTSLVHTHIT